MNEIAMEFTKMQGAGNDFVVVKTSDVKRDWSQLAIAMCDRHFGIGADGLLLLLPSETADFRMQVFNPDGSESNTCGNGLRCLVKYFVDGNSSNGSEIRRISIETGAGIRIAQIEKTVDKATKIQTFMGKPGFGEKEVPLVVNEKEGDVIEIKSIPHYSINVVGRVICLSLLSIGNPHAVYFCQESVNNFPLSEIGPIIEHDKAFPARTNFSVARVISRDRIEARTWERGVGETLACGSGACAITVVAKLLNYVDNKVDVILPGGVLRVEWDGIEEVILSGPAETVYTGEWLE
jgi:diaminopimelate epimerase